MPVQRPVRATRLDTQRPRPRYAVPEPPASHRIDPAHPKYALVRSRRQRRVKNRNLPADLMEMRDAERLALRMPRALIQPLCPEAAEPVPVGNEVHRVRRGAPPRQTVARFRQLDPL